MFRRGGGEGDATVMGSGRESGDAPEGLKGGSGGYVREKEGLSGACGNVEMGGEMSERDG